MLRPVIAWLESRRERWWLWLDTSHVFYRMSCLVSSHNQWLETRVRVIFTKSWNVWVTNVMPPDKRKMATKRAKKWCRLQCYFRNVDSGLFISKIFCGSSFHLTSIFHSQSFPQVYQRWLESLFRLQLRFCSKIFESSVKWNFWPLTFANFLTCCCFSFILLLRIKK